MEERRGKRKRDGQVEMERQEARFRAERLDTSQHSKEETQLTRIRDINERTATRAGDLGHVEGGIHVATGENTEGHPGLGPGGGKPKRASPVPSSFTMPSPSALFCLSKALRSRTLRERKERR